MKKNIGNIDKIIRVVLGLVAIISGVMIENVFLGIIGILLLISAYLAFCPLYKVLKLSTKENSDDSCGCGSCGCH